MCRAVVALAREAEAAAGVELAGIHCYQGQRHPTPRLAPLLSLLACRLGGPGTEGL